LVYTDKVLSVSELYQDKEGVELSETLFCSLQTKDDFDDDVDNDDGDDKMILLLLLLLLLLLVLLR
jgi:hypothetical protein